MRHNGRSYLVGGTEGKNRSKLGVWDICSYESLRPIDSSSQSGNFLSRLQIEYNSFPEFLAVSRGAQIKSGGRQVRRQVAARGRGWAYANSISTSSDSCRITIARLKVRDCSPRGITRAAGKVHMPDFYQVVGLSQRVSRCLELLLHVFERLVDAVSLRRAIS